MNRESAPEPEHTDTEVPASFPDWLESLDKKYFDSIENNKEAEPEPEA